MKETGVIEDFSMYAEYWWSEKSWLYPLQKMNNYRIPFLQNSLLDELKISEFSPHKKFPLEGVRVLDVGCGGGFLSEGLAKKGAETTGIDPSADLIRIATEHSATLEANLKKPRYIKETIGEHSIKHPQYYDCVICSEVIEHVDTKDEFIDDCLKVLKPGGSLIFTTPHKIIGYVSFVLYGEYIARINPKGAHEWGKLISISKMKSLLKKKGCKIGRTDHILYNPLFKKWMRSRIVPMGYFVHAIKPNQ